MEREIVYDAMKCTELEYSLDRISSDDDCDLADYSDSEIIAEARYVISLYAEGGTSHSEMLDGRCGKASQREARRELRELKAFLRKHGELGE